MPIDIVEWVDFATVRYRYLSAGASGGPAGPQAAQVAGSIVVVSAAEGPGPLATEHISVARHIGAGRLVIAVNLDGIDDPELVELVQLEVQDLAASHGFDSAAAPSALIDVRGSLADDPGWPATIQDLVARLDAMTPGLAQAAGRAYVLTVEGAQATDGIGGVAAVLGNRQHEA
jgi:elongation factor Tu